MTEILLVKEPFSQLSRAAIEQMGHACVSVRTAQDAEAALQAKGYDLLLCPVTDKTGDFRLFDFARRVRPECRCIAVVEDSLEAYFPELLSRDYPANFVADNHPVDLAELRITIEKLSGGDIFGIGKYGIPVAAELRLRSSAEKYPAIEQVREFFLARGVSERIVRNVELILNELLMNAIYDAPGQPRSDEDRSAAVEFPDDRGPRLSYGFGETYLAVSVSDGYGRMTPDIFFANLHRCFSEKSVLEIPGKGAGLGLFLVFKSLDKMVINVARGRETEVIALLDHRSSLGELKRRKHSFHFFQVNGIDSQSERVHS
jgi:hypothetical protein